MKLKDLNRHANNPRRITDQKIKQLKKTIQELGCLDGILYNVRTKTMFGGHQRQTVDPEAPIQITTRFDTPTKTGTVALGTVLIEGEEFPYREVDWDENKESVALLAANKGAGEWDYGKLSDIVLKLDEINYDLDLTMFDNEERERLFGGWDSPEGSAVIDNIEENLDGITETIKVKCPKEIKDEVLIYLKAKFLEVSFEGIEIV